MSRVPVSRWWIIILFHAPTSILPRNLQLVLDYSAASSMPDTNDVLELGPTYSTVPQTHQQIPSHQQISSPTDLRQGQVFSGAYQPYPSAPSSMGPSMAPSMAGSMPPHYGRQSGNAMASSTENDRDEDSLLFGDVPEGKRRKFILVDDSQRNTKIRVKVMLDQVEMSEIPDSFRKQNAVHQRSYFPVQMPDQETTSRDDRFVSADMDIDDGGLPTFGRVNVPVHTIEGEGGIDVPQLTRAKRGKEEKLNELGHRMAWSQGRAFAGRTTFLQKSRKCKNAESFDYVLTSPTVDAYRNKQRSALIAAGQEIDAIPAHLETRPGKRRWLERARGIAHTATPPPAINE